MRRESFALLRPAALRSRRDAPLSPAGPARRGAAVAPRSFGVERLDAWLGGGLKGDGLHEFHAAAPVDLPSALSVALLLGLGRAPSAGRLLWLRREGGALPYGPGLAALGLDPDAIAFLVLKEDRALLRAAHDAVRAGAATVLLELGPRQRLPDLTASRRLLLASAEAGVATFLVRAGVEGEVHPPSAAHSRWRIASAPSRPLAADAPGQPAFALDLLRLRGGREGFSILLEWDHDRSAFIEQPEAAGAPPLSGDPPALAGERERGDARGRAA